ncbi:MAG: hypothetical protein ACK50U_11395, partial [Acidobacteriota bacterium]
MKTKNNGVHSDEYRSNGFSNFRSSFFTSPVNLVLLECKYGAASEAQTLRANIAETLPVSLIREQGGGANRNEQAVQEWSSLGVGGRGTEWRRA